jgi:integrase
MPSVELDELRTRAVWVGLANGGAGDEVEVVKKRQRNRLGASASQTILWPVVSIAEAPPDLTEAQFAALETAGRISLTLETRRALNNIAESWVSHDQMLRSPRPANFRSRLQSIRTSLEKAHARADLIWTLPKGRTKNGKPHIVHLSNEAIVVLNRANKIGPFVFSIDGAKSFQEFSRAKRELDELSGVTGWRLHDLRRTCVSGMARLGIPPHVADKILNHQSGTISGVAAVY